MAPKIDGMRKFQGPFYVLGILPAWPKEFERRAGRQSGWTPGDQLMREMTRVAKASEPKWLVKRAAGVDQAYVDGARKALLAQPMTARQLAKRLRTSEPTAKAALLRLHARRDADGKYQLPPDLKH